MKYSVVIPCYNSEKQIENTVNDIIAILSGNDYEIILVNDYSRDQTFKAIRKMVMSNENIIGINLAHNCGQHNATMAGLNYVSGDRVWICADDGQSPIDAFKKMVSALDGGADVVCARYNERGKRSLFRRFGSFVAEKTSELLIDRPNGVVFTFDFMAERYVVDEMIKYNGPFSNMEGLIFRATWNVENIVAVQHSRVEGKSGYTLKKLLALWLNGFTAFSIKPLRMSGAIGVIVSLIGFIYLIVNIVRRLIGIDVQLGWTSIMFVLLLSSGLQFIIISLLGEYVGRIYMCINNSPQFVVKEKVVKETIKDRVNEDV